MNNDLFKKWEHLIQGVAKERIPVEFIKKLVLKLEGRRRRTINVRLMIEQGLDPDEIEEAITEKLEEYDEEMIGIEFILDIEGIADVVQPETDILLRGI